MSAGLASGFFTSSATWEVPDSQRKEKKVKVKSLHLLWLCDPTDCGLPGSSIQFFFVCLFVLFMYYFILFFNFIILYLFCHTLTWIHHECTCVPHPEPSSHLPPHTIPLGHPSAPAPSIQYHALNPDWRLISYMILYMFQCHSPKSSHPLPLPQSPKDCSIHQCLFCCFVYTVIVTIFLNSIYMH